MTAQAPESAERRWAPAYRAYCPACRSTGRPFTSYGNAEEAARGHAAKHGHVTHVIDQYGLKVIGSTTGPDRRPP